MLTVAAKNAMLDGTFSIADVSLHTAYSASGASEVTGGSPAYARKAITFAAASAGSRAASSTPTLDVPAASTVKFAGLWGLGSPSQFLGMMAVGGSEKEILSLDLTTDVFSITSHGWVDTDTIVFYGGVIPAPLVEGTTYFVRDGTTHTFKVAATSGGAAIDITALPDGQCVVSKIAAETFGSQGTFQVNSGSLSLNA